MPTIATFCQLCLEILVYAFKPLCGKMFFLCSDWDHEKKALTRDPRAEHPRQMEGPELRHQDDGRPESAAPPLPTPETVQYPGLNQAKGREY